jgi:hypothetical protein
LIAATLYRFANGSVPRNVLPLPHAMYSVQSSGRFSGSSHFTRYSNSAALS